jgi:uncharacterized protein (TIGR02246 family)
MDCGVVRGEESSVAEIARTFERWRAAVGAGDLDVLLGLVTEDAEFWTHSRPALRGRDALRAAMKPLLGQYEMDQEFDCLELIVEGPWAFARGTEINHVTPVDGGEPIIQRQRAFSVLRRGEDGVWRFARGMTIPAPQEGEAAGG